MYRWIDEAGIVLSIHGTLESAGRQHRRLCRVDVRCIAADGQDVTDLAIVSSIWW